MSRFSCIIIGDETLTLRAAQALRAAGHDLRALVSDAPALAAWAATEGVPLIAPGDGLAGRLAGHAPFDWLLSIANLALIPDAVLALARRGAVNFHDGPLPRYAGLNAPVWAALRGEAQHGVTWHLIGAKVDAGDILLQRMFEITPDDTALSLNTRCMSEGIESLPALVDLLAQEGTPPATAQDLTLREWFGRDTRPEAAARLDFSHDAASVLRLVRALDHGSYANPLACPKIVADGQVLMVGGAEAAAGSAAPGTVLEATPEGLVVACATGAVRLGGLRRGDGRTLCPSRAARPGEVLPGPDAATARALDKAIAALAPHEPFWRGVLEAAAPALLALASAPQDGTAPDWVQDDLPLPADCTPDQALAALALWAAQSCGRATPALACTNAALAEARQTAPEYVTPWVPLVLDMGEDSVPALGKAASAALAAAEAARGFAIDLPLRLGRTDPPRQPDLGLSTGDKPAPVPGTCLSVGLMPGGDRLVFWHDQSRLAGTEAALLRARLEHLLAQVTAAGQESPPADLLRELPAAERAQLLTGWNGTEAPFDASQCLHHGFEAQAARTPEATALCFEGATLSYGALERRANQIAHVLRAMGVGPGVPVGLYLPRGLDLLAGALGILKAGGAYLPLDPAYPPERIAHYLSDSAAPVVVTLSDMTPDLPAAGAALLELDRDPRLASAPHSPPEAGAGPGDMAYLIYTSGSTGLPKGVVVEHRQLANFFTGMDAHIRHDPPGVWLALTSLSFDISVLELFWTLARGFKVVLVSDGARLNLSQPEAARPLRISDKPMEFSLYYWGNDDGPGPRKYGLLLEGARFADNHGFCAVWTPERHFHAFGGPYPNPSVTGAAVAAVTKNLSVRAGSCVVPLHHPARIAEEWAVIDNLTAGRAGLGVASGWQPDDFVLRPENAPPDNKRAMYAGIEQLRALWRGEKVEFPRADGSLHALVTQPRPVSKELPLWLTIAGNPDTWREAGEIGAHVLTHLLGQSIYEVAGKIGIYHDALRKAGHDPADFTVTLMLHTFVARDRELARDIARDPMKAYLAAAVGLVKQYAWSFPAFKKPRGVDNPADLDLDTLSADEVDSILEFAFLRYFEDSGLFGTVEDCLARVEQLKAIGVTEVACLIDYGIAPEQVMEGLYPLAEVLRRANTPDTEAAADDLSIAGQIRQHGVTHLQCTPSMARLLMDDAATRAALAQVEQVLLGGEALPGALATDITAITGREVLNMYGPTETTIWSSVARTHGGEGTVEIGQPIANTQLYVLDEALAPCPVGVAGELFIGGEGVARGYWQREALTAERFIDNPFGPGRLYRSGDMVLRRGDGRLEFLGRCDTQVKIRGHRIEPGEVEAQLEALPGVAQAVVVAREDRPGDRRLVAYVTGADAPAPDACRDALAAELPAVMVPDTVLWLDTIPLTPNGKIDRKALPAPHTAPDAAMAGDESGAEQTPVAQRIAEIWAQVLGVAPSRGDDNFFALGGHSLLAVQAHREIRAALEVPALGITDVFRFPTLNGLARHVETLSGAAPVPSAAPPDAAPDSRAQARGDAMARRRALRNRRSMTG